jgi:mannose-6-phosphate isomerase
MVTGQTGAMQRVEGVVQHYAWGDPEYIPRLLGVEPDGRPWAELWLGTHPNGPARLADGRPLSEITGRLPYLLKVLAARQPLSLQTHPNADQARDGFERGLCPDPFPKPELLYALTPFHALCGVRPLPATLRLLQDLGVDQLARVLAVDGPGATLAALVRGDIDPAPAIEACRRDAAGRPEASWVCRLDDLYPGEPSVAVTLLLNLVVLEPGQALRLDAGNLHAYLQGAGIELMGASDNTVRAGLTPKPVDVDLLLRIVDPTPIADPVLPDGDRFELPAAGVTLRLVGADGTHVATGHELAVDRAGGAWYLAPDDRVRFTHETFVVTAL